MSISDSIPLPPLSKLSSSETTLQSELTIIRSIIDSNELENHGSLIDHAIDILAAIESVPETKEEIGDWFITAPIKKSHAVYSLTAHKKHAQGAWLAVMKSNMEKDRRKRILGLMTSCIT